MCFHSELFLPFNEILEDCCSILPPYNGPLNTLQNSGQVFIVGHNFSTQGITNSRMSSQFTPSLSYHMWWVLARTIWSKAQQSGQGTWGMVSLGESPQGGKAPPQKKKPRWLTIRHSWQAWGTKRSDLTWGQAT